MLTASQLLGKRAFHYASMQFATIFGRRSVFVTRSAITELQQKLSQENLIFCTGGAKIIIIAKINLLRSDVNTIEVSRHFCTGTPQMQ